MAPPLIEIRRSMARHPNLAGARAAPHGPKDIRSLQVSVRMFITGETLVNLAIANGLNLVRTSARPHWRIASRSRPLPAPCPVGGLAHVQGRAPDEALRGGADGRLFAGVA